MDRLVEKEEVIRLLLEIAFDEEEYPRYWSEKRLGKRKEQPEEEEQTLEAGIPCEGASHSVEVRAVSGSGTVDNVSTSQSGCIDELLQSFDVLLEENKSLRADLAKVTCPCGIL